MVSSVLAPVGVAAQPAGDSDLDSQSTVAPSLEDCTVVSTEDVIQDVIDDAAPGETICIESGTYSEELEITTEGVSLVGVGAEKPVLSAPWGADRGIHLDGVGGVTIENIAVEHFDEYGILLASAPDTTLTDVIVANNGEGIVVQDSDDVLISESEVSGQTDWNAESTLTISESTGVELRDSTIAGNGYDISISNADGLVMADNEIIDNTQRDGTRVVISNSLGVTVSDNVLDNQRGGIVLEGATDAVVTNNQIADVDEYGLHLHATDGAYVENNTVTGSGAGIDFLLESSADLTLTDNTFDSGVFFDGDDVSHFDHTVSNNVVGDGTLYYVSGTDDPAVPDDARQALIVDSSNVALSDESFEDVAAGLQVAFSDGAQITDLEVTNAHHVGLHVVGSDDALIERVTATDNGIAGIQVAESTGAALETNTVSGNDIGIHVVNDDGSTVENNTATGNAGDGVRVSDSGDTVVADNDVTANDGHGLAVSNGSGVGISNNDAENNDEDGIHVADSGAVSVTGNALSGNENNGIGVTGSDGTVVDDNIVTNNGETGVAIADSVGGAVTNTVATGSDYGIHVVGADGTDVSYNDVSDNTEGIVVEDSSTVVVDGNEVRENSGVLSEGTGIIVLESQDTRVENNDVTDNDFAAIIVDQSDGTTVEDNTAGGHEADLILTESTTASVFDNTFETGLFIDGETLEHFEHEVDGNTVGGEELFYAKGGDAPEIPDDVAQVFVVGSTNVDVSGHELDGVATGIQVAFSDGAEISENAVTHSTLTTQPSASQAYMTTQPGGITVRGSDDASLRENTVAQNAFHGIRLADSDDVEIESNTVSDNQYGISLVETERALLEGNTVLEHDASNRGIGIEMRSSSAPELRTNEVHHNRNGIELYETAGGLIENNNATANNYGLYVRSSSGTAVLENAVTDNDIYGIFVTANSNDVLVEGNVVEDSGWRGILFSGTSGDGAPTDGIIRNNVVTNSGHEYTSHSAIGGIQIGSQSGAATRLSNTRVENNTVTDSAEHNILAMNARSPLIVNNTVDSAGEDGIRISRTSTAPRIQDAIVRENTVTNSNHYGISVSSAPEALVRENDVSGSGDGGIRIANSWVSWQDPSRVVWNTVSDTDGHGIIVSSQSETRVGHNYAAGNQADLLLDEAPDSRVLSNEFQTGVLIEGDHLDYYAHNFTDTTVGGGHIAVVEGDGDDEFEIDAEATQLIFVGTDDLTLTGDDVSEDLASVQVAMSEDVSITDLEVSDGLGIHATRSTGVTVDGVTVSNVSYGGVTFDQADSSTIANSTITDNRDHGILLEDSNDAAVSDNAITGNAAAGIYGLIHENADGTAITANAIDENRVGIELEGLQDGWGTAYIRDVTAHDNVITNNEIGIHAHYRVDDVDVQFNEIAGNDEGVVYDFGHPSWPMDARHTWWGETSGPSGDADDPETERSAGGTGDSVDDHVLFDPWDDTPPGPTFEISVDETNAPVAAGEALTVDVTVENLAEESDTQTIELVDFEGTVVDAVEDLTLEGGETDSFTLTWQTPVDVIGIDEITVRSASHSATETVELERPPAEAFFDVTIDGTNAPVNAGEELEVTATIENVGDEDGTQTIALEDFDGAVVDSHGDLALSGGETETVSLTWATDEGDHGQGDVTVRSEDDSDTERVTLLSDDAVEVDACTVIDASGNYVLAGDLDGGATCLEIAADDVVLDGMGYTVQGENLEDDGTQYGIAVTGADGVTVSNVTVSGWDVGLYYNEASNGAVNNVVSEHNGAGFNLRSANDNDVSSLTTRYNDNRGLQVGWGGGSSYGNTFTDVHAYGNEISGSAFYPGAVQVTSGSTNNEFVGLNASSNMAGLRTTGSSNTFTDVVADDNSMYGLNLESNQGNAFENVSVARNGWNGIIVDDSNGNLLTDVTAVENEGVGVLLMGDTQWNTPVTGNVFHSVTATDNDDSGVQLSVADNNEFHDLELHNNDGSSLNLASRSSENTFTNVVIADSGWHGLFVGPDSHNNTVTGLSVSNSEAAGIAFSDASGNEIADVTVTASGSGFQSFQGATDNTVSSLELDGVTLSFEAQDVMIDGADEPDELPEGAYPLGAYLTVAAAGDDSYVDSMFVHYDAADLASIDESTLELWRLSEAWSAPSDESYDTDVNTTEKYVYATNIDEFGTFGVFSDEPDAVLDVIDATLDTDELVAGESATVTATVENAGDADGNVTVALEVDGDIVDTATIELEAGDTEQVTFTHTFETSGTFDVTVSGTHAGTITVLEGAEIVVYDGSVDRTELGFDETVTITGDLYNSGDVADEITVVLGISGEHVDEERSEEVTIEPGIDRNAVEFEWTPTEETLPDGVDSDEVTITLNGLVVDTVSLEHQYSDIQVIAASTSETEVVGGNEFHVVGSVYQAGTIEGPEEITLTATPTDGGDPIELGSQDVTLEPGFYHLGALNITASFEPDDAGSYDLELGDRYAGTVEVEPAESDITVIAAGASEIELIEGEEMYVTGSIYQVGNIEGTEEIELTATNTETNETEVVGSQEVTLSPGFYHLGALNITHVPDEAGTYDLDLGDRYAGTIEVEPAESDITVIAAGVSEVEAVEGEELYVTGSIYQAGTIDGPETIELTATNVDTGEIDVLGSQEVTLEPGFYHLGALNITFESQPGTYELELGDRYAGTVEVEPAESDISVIAAGVSNVEAVEGDELYVTGSVYQAGNIDGPETIELTATNVDTGETDVLGSQEISLDPGFYHLGALNITFESEPGTYDLELGDRYAGTIEVEPAESDIQVIAAGASEVEVTAGEELYVTGSIYQAGNIDGPETIELTATNTETNETEVMGTQEVTLQPGFYHLGALNVTYVPEEAGEYELELGDRGVATISVNEVATDIQVIASSLSEAEVIEGEPVHVVGSVYQNGSDEATETIELTAINQETGESSVVDSQDVTLQPGFYHLGALNVTFVPDEAGTYDLVLGDRDVGTVEVVAAESDIQVIAASVSEIELVEGEELYVTGSIYQAGTIDGPETIELTATNTDTGESTVVGSQEVTLEPGFYHLGGLNVTYAPDEAGTYDLELGDRHAGTIEVEPAESDISVIAAGVSAVELVEGEELYVVGSIYQNGTIDGPQEIELTATNVDTGETEVVGTQEVTLSPGFYHLGALNITYVPDEAGEYDLELGDRYAGTIEVVSAESDIQVIAASASALEVAEGQEFHVTGSVYQAGTVEGAEEIVLTATPTDGGDPIELGSQEVTLTPGWYHLGAVNVSATLEQPGTYDLELGDRSAGRLVVTQATVEPTIVAVEGHSSASEFVTADGDLLDTEGSFVYASDDATVEIAVAAAHPIDEVTVLVSSLETTYSVSTEAALEGDTWVAEIPFEDLPDDGRYELTAVAADERDNGGMAQATETLVINREDPEMTVTIENVDSESATIVVESNEPLEDIPGVWATVQNPDGTTASAAVTMGPETDDATRFTGTLEFDESGNYTVTAVGTDLAGNEGENTASVVIDTRFTLRDGVIEIDATGTTIEFDVVDDADEAIKTEELFVALSENTVNPNLEGGQLGAGFLTAELDSFIDHQFEQGTIESATITLAADEDALGGADVNDASLHYYDDTTGAWDPVDSSVTWDGGEPFVVADVTGFSTYGILVIDETPPVLEGASPGDGERLPAGTDQTTVEFEYADELSGVDLSSVTLSVDGTDVTTAETTRITSTSATHAFAVEDGESYVATVTLADAAGNVASYETAFEVETADDDGSPPSTPGPDPDPKPDPEPTPDISVVAVDSSPTAIASGETVTVTATLENTGDAAGTSDLTLWKDGTAVNSMTVTVAAGDTTNTTLSHRFDEPGTYELELAETVFDVTVKTPCNEADGPKPGTGDCNEEDTDSPPKTCDDDDDAVDDPCGDGGGSDSSDETPSESDDAANDPRPTPDDSDETVVDDTDDEAGDDDTIPGFGVTVALIGLVLYAVVLSRRGTRSAQ